MHSESQDGEPSVADVYRSVADLAYQKLRDDIFTWTLRPGEKLSYEAIAARLGVSTMPVREGIRRLEA